LVDSILEQLMRADRFFPYGRFVHGIQPISMWTLLAV
jgi:hypothetical protein